MLTSEILNLAADKIEQHGWSSGPGGWDGQDYETGVPAGLCLEGGILAAAGMTSQEACGAILLEQCSAARAVHAYLQLPADYELWEWNDISIRYGDEFNELERTGEEVIEVLRGAALVEQVRESATIREEVAA